MKSLIAILSLVSISCTVFAGSTNTAPTCFNKNYDRLLKERTAIGAVMTADLEEDIRNHCASESK